MIVKNCEPYYNVYPREKCVSDVMEVMKRSARKGFMILVGGQNRASTAKRRRPEDRY